MGNASLFDFQFSGDGKVWLLATNKIMYTDCTLVTLGRDDGFKTTVTANSWNCYDSVSNKLYICCNTGIRTVDIEDIGKKALSPKIAINSITIDGKRTDTGSGIIEIPKGATRISFDPALLSFSGQEHMLTYYLEGFGEQPITVKNMELHEISYTNLKGGRYILHLSNGDASSEISIICGTGKCLLYRPSS